MTADCASHGARLRCPHCGTDDVRKVSLLYEQATSDLNFRALSLGDRTGATYTAGSGGVQTLLGGRIAPPAAPPAPIRPAPPLLSALWSAFWLLVVGRLALRQGAGFFAAPAPHGPGGWVLPLWGVLMAFPVAITLPLYGIRRAAYARNRARYRRDQLPRFQSQMQAWSRAWMCRRCGETFARDGSSTFSNRTP